jgi:hypothetical protein
MYAKNVPVMQYVSYLFTIMGNIFEEYHAPYTSKKSFVDLNIK